MIIHKRNEPNSGTNDRVKYIYIYIYIYLKSCYVLAISPGKYCLNMTTLRCFSSRYGNFCAFFPKKILCRLPFLDTGFSFVKNGGNFARKQKHWHSQVTCSTSFNNQKLKGFS